MSYESRIIDWLTNDSERLKALEQAADLGLSDWCLAAGFVRNLVWDQLHGRNQNTPLNDIDLIHFDQNLATKEYDRELESELLFASTYPWSVKNQARMHVRNGDAPYTSSSDAMRYWIEIETAIGATLADDGSIELLAPFGFDSLFAFTITLNPYRPKLEDFKSRCRNKRWLELWPRLKVKYD